MEDTYGRIFESFCHPMLQSGCTLRIRKLEENGAEEATEITLPNTEDFIVRFDGHDPSNCAPTAGRYFWPHSTSFPSYDAMLVVEEKVLFGGDSTDLVCLNLQMTVSGVTGYPVRPKHKLLQYMRQGVDKAMKNRFPAATAATAPAYTPAFKKSYTVFVVPEICFEVFSFQKESRKTINPATGTKSYCVHQPSEQFVIMIPQNLHMVEPYHVATRAEDE